MTVGKMLSYFEVDVPRVRAMSFAQSPIGPPASTYWSSLWAAGSLADVEENPDLPTGRGLRFLSYSADEFGWAFNPAGNLEDVTVLAGFVTGPDMLQGVMLRGTDDQDGYSVLFDPEDGSVLIFKTELGSATSLAEAEGFLGAILEGTLVWMRADVFTHVDGATVRAKVWTGELADEPEDFATFYIDESPLTGAGAVGWSPVQGEAVLGFFHVRTLGLEEDTFRFAIPTDYLPSDIEAIPSIRSMTYQAASVSLGKDLGRRATLAVSFRDHPHTFFDEPFDVGTFFGKWRATYGQTLRGRSVRFIQGFLGQDRDSMEIRHLVVEATDGPTPEGDYTISAKDPIKFLDDDRAQAPVLSNGSLAGGLTDTDVAATLSPTGIGDEEYPSSFHACLGGKEIVEVTRTGDSLAITRGQLGTSAITHSAGDRVQVVLYYPGNLMSEIAYDLITEYTDFDPALIVLADWTSEVEAHLPVLYASAITEPTGVNKLLSSLIEQSATALAWDDRANTLRLQVLREIPTDAEVVPEERIVAGSLRVAERPKERVSQHWTWYGQRNPTDRGDNSDNYRATKALTDLERETLYGGAEIRKIFANWVPTEAAADRLNQIVMSRFRDPPRKFSFDLFQGHLVQILGGYRLEWRQNQDLLGRVITNGAPIQVVKISVEPGLIHVEAEEMLATGEISLVNVVILTETGGVLEWEVPADWNDADNSIHCLGPGGGGGRGTGDGGGSGGGGGAYSAIVNANLTPSTLVDYQVGVAGAGGNLSLPTGQDATDTWFGGATLGASLVGAKGGKGGAHGSDSGFFTGAGGLAASGVGTTKTSGGDGGAGAPKGSTRAGGGGGGGAGGPNGDGGDGLDLFSSSNDGGSGGGAADGGESATQYSGSDGGDGGNNRFGFGGGTVNNPNGLDGGGGKGGISESAGTTGDGGDGEPLWTQTVSPIFSAGPGGGGGGGGSDDDPGGRGGDFGGGGGGGGGDANQFGGTGGRGCIVIIWAADTGT